MKYLTQHNMFLTQIECGIRTLIIQIEHFPIIIQYSKSKYMILINQMNRDNLGLNIHRFDKGTRTPKLITRLDLLYQSTPHFQF